MDDRARRTAFSAAAVLSRIPLLRSTAAAVAARRGRALVLLYHRVSDRPSDIVPVVSPDTLAGHLDAISAVADIVSMETLLRTIEDQNASGQSARPQVAVTFDDDDRTHVEGALPVLARLRLPATFFLSGRSLHDLPPYWWEQLEAAIASHGLHAVRRVLGVAGDTAAVVRACQDPAVAGHLDAFTHARHDTALAAADMRALDGAGMTIGFHTLRHSVLPLLDDGALDVALREGRRALADAAGVDVDTIAYPHGRADERVSRAARQSGYRAGFVTGGRAVTPGVDPFLVPRWEPGPIGPRRLVAEALVRLHAATHAGSLAVSS